MSIDQMKNPDAPKQIRDPNTLKELDDLIKGGDPAKVVKYIKNNKKENPECLAATALRKSIQLSKNDVTGQLLKNVHTAANMNFRFEDGHTCFTDAIIRGNIDALEVLTDNALGTHKHGMSKAAKYATVVSNRSVENNPGTHDLTIVDLAKLSPNPETVTKILLDGITKRYEEISSNRNFNEHEYTLLLPLKEGLQKLHAELGAKKVGQSMKDLLPSGGPSEAAPARDVKGKVLQAGI